MDDMGDEARYPRKHSKPPIRNRPSYPFTPSFAKNYQNAIDYEEEEEEEEDDELDEDEENPEFEEEEEELEYNQNLYYESERLKKKARVDNSLPNYAFAPRGSANLPQNPFFVRNLDENWTENGTFLLLEVWGDRFMQLGRKSLRGEDWAEVAEKSMRTEIECRNRLDVLKKKYKRERARIGETGGGYSSKWVFFKKMDVLLNSRKEKQQCVLSCGVDSGEYVFMDSGVYLNRSNGLDEMRDSPAESEEEEEKEGREEGGGLESLTMLADSIHKFGEIYEKIESSKRKQMMELEKMRVDFQRELELQQKHILQRTQAEIAKIRQGDDEETDVSSEDVSG